jgi:NAD(P)-dependent dehydrogenase (short-subunit alcohol dehydrogenase family)
LPLKRDEKDHFGLASPPPPADTVNANTSTGIPLGVVGRPDEIAETVVWMVKTGYLTNKVVSVDGGMLPQ